MYILVYPDRKKWNMFEFFIFWNAIERTFAGTKVYGLLLESGLVVDVPNTVDVSQLRQCLQVVVNDFQDSPVQQLAAASPS